MKKKNLQNVEEPIVLNIEDDEIWTYRVEGLAAPHINKPYKNFTLKKIIFTLVIIIAVSVSSYFSVMTVQKDTFEYEKNSSGYTLTKFSNTGTITELSIDTFNGEKVTAVGQYAVNCDEKITVIRIGKDVKSIDPKAFYSCYSLREIRVDDANPDYCDVDGVLYTRDMKRIICHPCDHDAYLKEQLGFEDIDENSENYDEYVEKVLTFVVPSTVETIGELCFNYSELKTVYLPEGLKTIETLGFFKIPLLSDIYTYSGETNTSRFESEDVLDDVYVSLPESLQYIGSDAFSYNQALSYIYIPENVEYIGHHAFWDTVYKESKELCGITKIHVALSEEEFEKVKTGNNWRPQYDYLLFKKSVDIIYSTERGIE